MDIFELMAFLAGALIVISGLPQLIKTIKTKEVKDLSLFYFLILFSGQILWLLYGIHLKDLPIMLSNIFSMLIIFSIIILILRYRNA